MSRKRLDFLDKRFPISVTLKAEVIEEIDNYPGKCRSHKCEALIRKGLFYKKMEQEIENRHE